MSQLPETPASWFFLSNYTPCPCPRCRNPYLSAPDRERQFLESSSLQLLSLSQKWLKIVLNPEAPQTSSTAAVRWRVIAIRDCGPHVVDVEGVVCAHGVLEMHDSPTKAMNPNSTLLYLILIQIEIRAVCCSAQVLETCRDEQRCVYTAETQINVLLQNGPSCQALLSSTIWSTAMTEIGYCCSPKYSCLLDYGSLWCACLTSKLRCSAWEKMSS